MMKALKILFLMSVIYKNILNINKNIFIWKKIKRIEISCFINLNIIMRSTFLVKLIQ